MTHSPPRVRFEPVRPPDLGTNLGGCEVRNRKKRACISRTGSWRPVRRLTVLLRTCTVSVSASPSAYIYTTHMTHSRHQGTPAPRRNPLDMRHGASTLPSSANPRCTNLGVRLSMQAHGNHCRRRVSTHCHRTSGLSSRKITMPFLPAAWHSETVLSGQLRCDVSR